MTSSPPRPLTSAQERRLRDYLDQKLLEVSRNHRKRSEPSTSLPTLPSYLDATRPLLSVILQIPLVSPSISLRTAFLLRLTNDVLTGLTGYAPRPEDLETLLDWLDDLDRAWVVVIKDQAWVPNTDKDESNERQDANTQKDQNTSASDVSDSSRQSQAPARTISQTERTRLRSLIMSFSSRLEEWLTNLSPTPTTITNNSTGTPEPSQTAPNMANEQEVNADSDNDSRTVVAEDEDAPPPAPACTDITTVLRCLELQDSFDELFSGTMNVLGDLADIVIQTGEEVSVQAC